MTRIDYFVAAMIQYHRPEIHDRNSREIFLRSVVDDAIWLDRLLAEHELENLKGKK